MIKYDLTRKANDLEKHSTVIVEEYESVYVLHVEREAEGSKFEGVLDIEQFCIDNNIDAEKVTSFVCSDNKLTELKGLDNLVNLKRLYCHNNELTQLDLSKLVNLIELYCGNNLFTKLDLSKLVNLKWFNNGKYKQPEVKPVILDNKR